MNDNRAYPKINPHVGQQCTAMYDDGHGCTAIIVEVTADGGVGYGRVLVELDTPDGKRREWRDWQPLIPDRQTQNRAAKAASELDLLIAWASNPGARGDWSLLVDRLRRVKRALDGEDDR